MNMPNIVGLTQTKIAPSVLILLASIFVVATGNMTFYSKLEQVYLWPENAGFLMSISVLLCCVTMVFTLLLNILMPVRLAISLVLFISALAGYFTDQFGAVIDHIMIRNVFETDIAEAKDLVSFSFFLRITLLGILPIALVWNIPLNKPKWLGDMRRRVKNTGIMFISILVVVGLCLVISGGQYASFFRQHKSLRYYANPIHPMYSVGEFVSQQFVSHAQGVFQKISTHAGIPDSDHHRELVIVVVGETARADHFSLNGYARQTNPLLEQEENLLSYSNIKACGTSTAISVPCMFSLLGRDNFDVDSSKQTENVLDIVSKANISVLWRDNNSDSKGVAERVPYQNFRSADNNPDCDTECRDVGMLSGLQEYIERQTNDMLIVLHQMGSHGPAYFKRYPKSFEVFVPACQTAELSACSDQEIINAYDNSILYTDYFLAEIVGFLKRNTPRYETAMLYISDHGESLGEKNLYLHGMPYMFAPKDQLNVPLIVWAGESSDIDLPATMALKQVPNSHDAVAQAILMSLEVESDAILLDSPPLLVMKADD
ncbi:MAG: lipid A ethanolaminephosphotransferase [Paraglaciecola sp.]|jgi:lipid A ethanolaminephosphotransferase